MGWRKGKALGLNEDGHKEHVKVFTKSDRKGWLKVYLQEQSSDCMCINSVVRKCKLLVFLWFLCLKIINIISIVQLSGLYVLLTPCYGNLNYLPTGHYFFRITEH